MADTNQNLVNFRLKWTLSISWTEVTVSNDIIRDTAIAITDASITLTNEAKTSFELVVWTIADWVLTLSKRGIKADQTLTEDSALKKEWRPWAIWYVTLFASDTLDIDVAWWTATIKNDITFTWDNTFSWWVEFNWTTNLPTFADTTARDAVYTTPVAWDKCVITGTWEQYYDGWIWNTLDVWTPTPDATTTVSGKTELATDAEVTAWTATWWTWASLVLTPEQQKKSISLKDTATNTDFWATDHFVINDWWTDKKITKDETRIAMSWSTTLQWTWEMATDAEVITWSSETLVVNPKQLPWKYISSATVTKSSDTTWSWTWVTLAAIPSNAKICVVNILKWVWWNGFALSNSWVIYLDWSWMTSITAQWYLSTSLYFWTVYKSWSNILITWDIWIDTSPVDTVTFTIDFRT